MVRDSFFALGIECRVLVVVNFQKQKFEAIFGALAGNIVRILCSYEYHSSEPGWHCHAACGDLTTIPLGYMRGPWVRRIPRAKQTHMRLDFKIEDELSAQRFAFDCYNIEPKGTLI